MTSKTCDEDRAQHEFVKRQNFGRLESEILRQTLRLKATDQSINQEWVFRSKFSVYSFPPWWINKYLTIFFLWDGEVRWAGIKAWNGGRIASHQGTFATSKEARFEQDQGVLLRAQKKQHIFQRYRFFVHQVQNNNSMFQNLFLHKYIISWWITKPKDFTTKSNANKITKIYLKHHLWQL